MKFIEYVCIKITYCTDMKELENHLSMNGYNFGIDNNRSLLFVFIEEVDYVKTILEDRDIIYKIIIY